MSLRALVADDSVLFRRVLADALGSLPGVEVVGSVSNGRQAVQRLKDLRPDVLTLDMEMPEMDGLAVLDALRQAGDTTAVIVVSALTRRGGQLTLRALEKGAFDFITKPDLPSPEQSREAIQRELAPRVRALGARLEIRNLLRSRPSGPASPSPAMTPAPAAAAPSASVTAPASGSPAPAAGLDSVVHRMNRLVTARRPEMVLVGVSTGGPNALAHILPRIPGDLGVPILVVQHMPPVFTQSLAESLSAKCALRVREAAQGDVVRPNTVYLAPGGRQMRLAPGPEGARILQITEDPPENNCRPSVDYLFRSAAHHLPGRSMAVILTGMGNDGLVGVKLLRRHGCLVLAQDEATCVVYGMPKAVVDAGAADAVLPLEAMAARITSAVRQGVP